MLLLVIISVANLLLPSVFFRVIPWLILLPLLILPSVFFREIPWLIFLLPSVKFRG
jgi:hypothetical protein